jgi:uncharacterized protein (UPF0303 family)
MNRSHAVQQYIARIHSQRMQLKFEHIEKGYNFLIGKLIKTRNFEMNRNFVKSFINDSLQRYESII